MYAYTQIMENRKYTCDVKHKLLVEIFSEKDRGIKTTYDLKKLVMLEFTPMFWCC